MTEILRVQSRRAARQRRMQIVQHAVAAMILVTTGADHLSHAHRGTLVLAMCEIIAGALLIGSIIRERLRRASHGGVAGVELAGAVMISVEAIEKTRGPHHVLFIALLFVQPVVLLFVALFDAEIASARYLKADDDSYEVRLRLFFRRRVRWSDVRAFHVAGNAIQIELADGRGKKISLRDPVDREAAIAWSADQFRKHGIAESVPQ